MRNNYFGKVISLFSLSVLSVLFIAGYPFIALAQDVKGSKDHPLISRYPGSVITDYSQREFDEYEVILGKVKRQEGKDIAEKAQRLEGKVTQFQYLAPKGRSVLEVYRNYEMALTKAGFQTLYSCRDAQCGETAFFGRMLFRPDYHLRHLVAKLSRPEGDVYVTLHINIQYDHGAGFPYMLDIIEINPMEAGLVTVNAAAMAGDIARTGHVAIYGIYFDFDKADVKPESEPALQEIAKLLQQDPNLKLHVVGHTDNVGDLVYNMDLSRRRAQAVVQELTTKYSIAPARLQADGVGPLSPVASNKTEEGRAKNRRVELVER